VLANAIIGLREGLEAGLVVSILIAFLIRSDHRDVIPVVWLGVTLAVIVSVTAGAVLSFGTTSLNFSFSQQEMVGGGLSVIAVGFVTWMIFWMRRTGRTLAAHLRGRLGDALTMGSLAVFFVALLAVMREGLETALFFYVAAQAAGQGTARPLIGFLVGIAAAVTIAYLIYRGAVRLNLSKFFSITGVLLIFVAAGILAYGVHDLQEAGIVAGLNSRAFDISSVYDLSTWWGSLIKGFFNVSPQTSVLEAVAWVLYVGLILPLFLGHRRRRRADPGRSPATSPQAPPTGSATTGAGPRDPGAPATAGPAANAATAAPSGGSAEASTAT
jgi:high-affinity iron transporter